MGRRRALSVALGLALLGCGTAPKRAWPEVAVANAWFGVRGAKCEAVVPVLGLAARLRAGTVSPWRMVEDGAWCAVAATASGAGLRIDSTALQVSELLALPAVSFYATRDAWSYTVFDRGEPVWSLESHLGEPLADGDPVRAAGLIEVDTHVVSDTRDAGKDLAALTRFAEAIGLRNPSGPGGPGRNAKVIEAHRHVDRGGEPTPERTLLRIPPGGWAALPPLGVVLVKAVEVKEQDGEPVPTYVIVDDMTTLRLPVARAEAMGMRPIASQAEVDAALKLIDDGVDAGDEAYDARRVKAWLEAMGKGALGDIARVYAALCDLRSSRALFQLEAGLLSTSREWLAEEIATARASQVDAIDLSLRALCE